MSLRSVPPILVACLCGHAAADRALQVTADDTPFSAADLASALRVRLPADGAPLSVHAITRGTSVVIAIGDTTRTVEIDGRTGPDAARLVALAAVDLALDDIAVVPTRAAEPSPLTIDVLGGASSWSSVLAGGSIDLALAHGRVVGALELALAQHVSGELGISVVPVRACIGLRADSVELRAGLAVVPTWVSNGAGDQTTLVGGTASARLRLAVSPSVRFVAAVGADAYTTQTTYVLGMSRIVTPWVAPWLGAGVEVTP